MVWGAVFPWGSHAWAAGLRWTHDCAEPPLAPGRRLSLRPLGAVTRFTSGPCCLQRDSCLLGVLCVHLFSTHCRASPLPGSVLGTWNKQ